VNYTNYFRNDVILLKIKESIFAVKLGYDNKTRSLHLFKF